MSTITYTERKKLAKAMGVHITAMIVYEEILETYIPGNPVKKRSQSDIARETGLSRPTVKKLLSYLIDAELIEDRDGYYVPVKQELIAPVYPDYGYGECYFPLIKRNTIDWDYITSPNTISPIYYKGNGEIVYRDTVPNTPGHYTVPVLPSSTITSTNDLSTIVNSTDNISTKIISTDSISTKDHSTSSISNNTKSTDPSTTVSGIASTLAVGSLRRSLSLTPQPPFSGVNLVMDKRKNPSEETKWNRMLGRKRKKAEELQAKINAIKARQNKTEESSVATVPVTPDSSQDITQPPSVAPEGSQSVYGAVAPVPAPDGYTWEELISQRYPLERLERIIALGPVHWEVRRRYEEAKDGANAYVLGLRDDDPLDTFDPSPYTSVGEMLQAELTPLEIPLDPNERWRGRGRELLGRWKARRNTNLTWENFLMNMIMGDVKKPDDDDPQYHVWYALYQQRKNNL